MRFWIDGSDVLWSHLSGIGIESVGAFQGAAHRYFRSDDQGAGFGQPLHVSVKSRLWDIVEPLRQVPSGKFHSSQKCPHDPQSYGVQQDIDGGLFGQRECYLYQF